MAKIILRMNPVDKRKALEKIFSEWVNITDAKRYFSNEELEKSKELFICDIMNGCTEHYTDMMQNEITERRPFGVHGVYDFAEERQIEKLIESIVRIAKH